MASEDRMINGYKQNTKGFGRLLRHSQPLDRALRYSAVQVAWYYRRKLPRSNDVAGIHSADQVKVFKRVPGGRRKDRMEMMVVAYDQKNLKNMAETLRGGLRHVSGGRTISRRGRVSG
ncbi:head-tail connector protein [Gordonia phage Pleakley]|uniref:Uncharacterized protein n=1 Tax=Gordonia phage Pleakley TaxID=2283246 RepID=A0A345M6G0_9CAUD|nr:head-tail connector protein [Gordonia phage Pleakley]AXH49768.1 hypothetical protein SEA_FURY_42 [Gordonia phage Fury]AXH66081.1 hypothetical protein SEA_PLEAKLEY_42 [Gordonia phage Pleakley]